MLLRNFQHSVQNLDSWHTHWHNANPIVTFSVWCGVVLWCGAVWWCGVLCCGLANKLTARADTHIKVTARVNTQMTLTAHADTQTLKWHSQHAPTLK